MSANRSRGIPDFLAGGRRARFAQKKIKNKGNKLNPATGLREKAVFSNFWITINPQIVADVHSKLGKTFREHVRRLFSTVSNIGSIIIFNRGAEAHAEFEPPFIEHVKAWFAIQRGDRFSRLHAHVLLCVRHKSSVHVDPDAVIAFFEKQGLQHGGIDMYFSRDPKRRIYVHIDMVRGRRNVLEYMVRGLPPDQAADEPGNWPEIGLSVRDMAARGAATDVEI